jgi:hypothetical protein
VIRPPTLTTTGLEEEDIVSSADCFVRHHQRQTDHAISDAFARLRTDAQGWSSFAALLDVARRRAPGLLTAPIAAGRHPGVDALEQLARAAERQLRPAAAWEGSGASWHGAVHSLARHLVATYPVPAFLGAAWYAGEDERGPAQRRWFVEHARGRPFRSLELPFAMTRRMEHLFLKSPAHLSVPYALRRAELLGLGAEPTLAETILATRPASSLEHGDFWQTAWRFLIANRGSVAPEQIAPLVDFFDGIRHERAVVETPSGTELRDPLDPDFSLKGRTVRSVLRLMHEWHRSLGRAASAARWTPSPFKPMRLEFPNQNPLLPPTVWLLVELTSAAELREEGASLRHCVAIYSRRCVNGDSRIWSHRRRHGDGPVRSVLTIEVDPRRQAIVQLRGWWNMLPGGRPFQIVRSWASRERLRILRW